MEAKSTIEWLDNTIHSYDLLLPDSLTIGLMGKYNLKQQDFINAREMVVATRDAYEALTNDRPEVKTAIDNRDEAVMELVDNISETQAILLQIFEKDPKQLKKYNLPLVNDEIGREMGILMVKDSSITGMIGGKHDDKEKEKTT
jgi:hypothetical protein